MKVKLTFLSNCLVILLIVAFFVFYIISAFEYSNIPPEYRDTAMVSIVDSFVKGRNPYSYTYLLNGEAPRTIADSGIINCFLPIAISKIVGTKPLISMYIANALYISIAGIAMGLGIYKITKNTLCSLIAILLTIVCCDRGNYLCLRPDTFAMMCISLFLFMSLEERNNKRIVLVSILTVSIFWAKPHYTLIGVSYFIYLIASNDYKCAIKYAVISLCCLLLSIIICQIVFPTHISVWFTRLYEMFLGVNTNGSSIGTVINKWIELAKSYWPIFAINIAFLVQTTIKKKNNKILLFQIISLSVGTISMFFFGKHAAAYLWYFNYIVMPFAIFICCYCLSRFDRKHIGVVCVIFVCIFTLTTNEKYIVSPFYAKTIYFENQSAIDLIKQYDKKDILLSPCISIYGLDNDKYNPNYGDYIYVPKEYSNDGFFKEYINTEKLFVNKYKNYGDTILNKINNKDYSLIVFDDVENFVFTTGVDIDELNRTLNENYHIIDEKIIKLKNQTVCCLYYLPND